MKIEIIPKRGGYVILFEDADPAVVTRIKNFLVALLLGRGYQFEGIKVEKRDNFLFFHIASADDRELERKDLFYSLDKATREYMKENPYS